MSKSSRQLIFLIGFALVFILLFSLCNPFKREVFILDDPHIDRFTQQSQASKIDLLWVVDNSGSMAPYQQNLGQNFERFIRNFLGSDPLDFQMGAITTDASEGGQLVQGKVLTYAQAQADPAQFTRDFQQLVNVGTSGANQETGLYNAFLAIRRPENQAFFRPNALLVMCILTDEEDQSGQVDGKTPVDYVEAFKQAKGGKRVMINAIVDTTGYAQLNNLRRYTDLLRSFSDGAVNIEIPEANRALLLSAKLTQGVVSDIKGNFAQSLNVLGGSISRLANSFPLSRKADGAARMLVYVNGEEAFPEDWVYDPELNMINFVEGYQPEAGAEVEVHYEVFHEFGGEQAAEEAEEGDYQ